MVTIKKSTDRPHEMAQWVKTAAAKPEDLNFVPGPHMMEEENQFLKIVF